MATAAEPSHPRSLVIGDMDRLKRFLCLGAESGTYTCDEKDPTKSDVQCIMNLLDNGEGIDVVEVIKQFSVEGRSAKQQPILYALALCAKRAKDPKTKQAAFSAFADVCRIPTHVFQFIKFAEDLCDSSGWGRAQRNAVAKWYNSRDPKQLALCVTKYRQRNGWSHRDLLRLTHVKPANKAIALVIQYVIKGLEKTRAEYSGDEACAELSGLLEYLDVVERVKHSKDEVAVAALIEKHRLVREHIPTWLLNSKPVWRALLQDMPMEAMIRSLGKLSALNMLDPQNSEGCIELVTDRLKSKDALHEAKLHPMSILLALMTYKKGEGEKGKKLKWIPNPTVVEALDQAFHNSFKNIEATGKRHLLAVDVSGSMQYGSVNGSSQLSPAVAAAAMAMVTARTELSYELVAFSSQGLTPIKLSADMNLQEVCQAISEVKMGGTDCSLPMKWSLENKKSFDIFMVFTDCDLCTTQTPPVDMLRKYRKEMNIHDARLVICALTSSGFTQADPQDAGMLDIAGFDAAAPQIVRNFITGHL